MSNIYDQKLETATETITNIEDGCLSSITDDINALFVTANVGSLFEDVGILLVH